LSVLFSSISVCLLAYAFAISDFSLIYVSNNSNSALALPFKIAATWGGHQGSMLFWVWVLACWGMVIALKKNTKSEFYASCVMQMLVAIFAWFTILASNPFEFNVLIPLEGRDLNPMLQDIGLIIHPPILYVGYVGFASVLALTVGGLLTGEHTKALFQRFTRHALFAWVFLSAGITLGAGWAYYELGWGGWWFWDPVENASLLPWLTATALLHSLVASRNKAQLIIWSYTLAIVTFCLSILGTFIVRSGVLISVHAFAVDPSKGLTLLAILLVVFVSSYGLLIQGATHIKSQPIVNFASKNFLLLVAILLLLVSTAIVIFGTFYPMVYQLIGLGNISVGAPYFNLLFGPITLLALFVMGLSPLMKWQHQTQWFPKKLAIGLLMISLAVAVFTIAYYSSHNQPVGAQWSNWAFITALLSSWVVLTNIWQLFKTKKDYISKQLLASLAHVGIAVMAFGASMNSFYSYEMTVKLGPNSQIQFGDYMIDYLDTQLYIAPNFTAEQGKISIRQPNGQVSIATPEKRHYPVRVMNMTEPSMTPFWDGDIYITLGEKLDTHHYAVRIQFKAFIRWIGLGALFVVISGCGLFWNRVVTSITRNKEKSKEKHEVIF
jgi:cytochrome c-type biogenesis protein CcmF